MRRYRQDIDMIAGDDLRIIVDVVDQAGDPIDISEAQEITWSVAPSQNKTATVTKTLTGGGIIITNNTGFYFDILGSESSQLNRRNHHEVEIVTAGGQSYTTVYGTFYARAALID